MRKIKFPKWRTLLSISFIVVVLMATMPPVRAASSPIVDQISYSLGSYYKSPNSFLAQKCDYVFTLKVSDADGVKDIKFAQLIPDYVHLPQLGVYVRATRGTGDSWVFSENDPYDLITLNTGACTHSTLGNQKTFNFYITFNWAWGDSPESCDNKGLVEDVGGNSGVAYQDANFGVEVHLRASVLGVSDYRCDPSQTLTFEGQWLYDGTTIPPPNGDYQVKIKLAGVQKGSTDTTLVFGNFLINDVTAESAVGSYSYTVEATYMAAAGSFPYPVIVDKIKVASYSVSDARASINENVNIDATLRYSSDNALLGPGSITINGYAATYLGNGVYRITRTSATVTSVTYNTVAGTESTYGLSTVNQNSQSTTVVWDTILITGMGNDDDRRDVNTFGVFWATAKLAFDNHALGSGDQLTIQGKSMTWNPTASRFEANDTKSTVQSMSYSTFTSGYEATYSITVGSMNGYSTTIIWDKIIVTLAANATAPAAGETIDSIITAVYNFDGNNIPSPTINILRNGTFYATGNFTDMLSEAGAWQYTVQNISELTYGLTAFSSNTLTVVWEGSVAIEIDQTEILDPRIPVNSNGTSYWHCRFSDNQSSVETGILYINGVGFAINSTGWATVTYNYTTTGLRTFQCSAVNVNGVTSFNQLTANVEVVWDKIEVYNRGSSATRVEKDADVTVWFKLRWQYDHVEFASGQAVKINDTEATWNSTNNRWELIATQSTTGLWQYVVTDATDNLYSITVLIDIVGAQSVIWDALSISNHTVLLPTDTVYIHMVFAYDNMPVSSGWISYGGLHAAVTNSTGWAAFNFGSVNNVEYGLEAYPISGGGMTLSAQNLTIEYVKLRLAPFTLRSTKAITDQSWNSETKWLTFKGSETIIIDVGNYGAPTRVTVNGENYYSWDYHSATQKLTISNVASTVGIYWAVTTPSAPTVIVGGIELPVNYIVTIIIMQGSIPVTNAIVNLGTSTQFSNASGYTFFSVPAGTYPITVTVEGITVYINQLVITQSSVWLIDLTKPQAPPTEVELPEAPPLPLTEILFITAIIMGVAVIGLIEWYRKTRA